MSNGSSFDKAERYRCHNCGFKDATHLSGLESLGLITSDCRPWEGIRHLVWCPQCGLVQKLVDEAFSADCCRIYDTYGAYSQSGGEEQQSFTPDGAGMARSERLLRELFDKFAVAEDGRLLDVGCGNGVLLKSFGALRPRWKLNGLDLDDKSRNEIESLPGVEEFYSCQLDSVPEQFDCISMLHCLEHVENPVQFLHSAASRLHTGGILLIEVPDFVSNPFDIIVADHCSHFTPEVLLKITQQAGFEPILMERGLISKEITFLGRMVADQTPSSEFIAPSPSHALCAIHWLHRTCEDARHCTEGPLGIFGTSIAGAWLFQCLGNKTSFFVDEDPSRRRQPFFDRPVISPTDLQHGQNVYLGFPPHIANEIAQRMSDSPAHFILPPNFAPTTPAFL